MEKLILVGTILFVIAALGVIIAKHIIDRKSSKKVFIPSKIVKVLFNIKGLNTDKDDFSGDVFLIEKDNNGYYVQKYFEKYESYEEILIEYPVDIECSKSQQCLIEEIEAGEVRYILLVPENTVIRNRK